MASPSANDDGRVHLNSMDSVKGNIGRNSRANNFAARAKPPSGRERRRPFNLRDSIEAVFQKMVPDGDDDDSKIDVPLKFWDFYNCEMMVHFLHAAVLYLYSYINLVAMEEISDEGSSLEDHKVEFAVQEQQRNLRRLAEHYGRIVLHCSNFERTKEDEKFFECFYYFTCAVLKLGIAPEYWGRMENELRYIFRGNMFNVNSARNNYSNHEELDKKTEWSGKADINFPDELSASVENVPNNNSTDISSNGLSFSSRVICKKNNELLDRVKLNLKESEGLREKISAKRKASPRLSNAGRFSVHSALSARSPIISLILPTQKEKADMSIKSIVEEIPTCGSLSARSSSQAPTTNNLNKHRQQGQFSIN